jgi:uncharacterized repeat protein (TIGR01451 family)
MLLVMVLSLAAPASAQLPTAPPERLSPVESANSAITQSQPPAALEPAIAAASVVTFTILHTNDFHGQLEASGSNPGMARVAYVVNQQRSLLGAQNVLLVDAGDEMQGSLLSNLQKGAPTIATFSAMSYTVATFGNHEFDWGQQVLISRTQQATYPFVTANIVVSDSGNCSTAGWTVPSFAQPYVIQTLNTTSGPVKVAFIGVSTTETPIITIASATAGLCFKDPADSILHYYDTLKANADVIVVLSHLGLEDGGYGYGIPVYGDKTLASKLITAGKVVPLIIGGHSHTNMSVAFVQTVTGKPGQTTIVQAYYNGRQVDRADLAWNSSTGNVTVAWSKPTVSITGTEDITIKNVIQSYASDPTYQSLINQPVGYTQVDLPRSGGTVDNMMGTFVDDAIYNYLNTDSNSANDIDLFFNNAGGIRTDWCYDGTTWVNTGCVSGTHAPALLTYGNMFTILPFGNATVVGDMTGAQILDVVNYGPLVSGVIQPAGLKYTYYGYTDTNPGPQPYAWGAYSITVKNRTTGMWEPLVITKTYRVGTNEFLAPGGGDGYGGFKYMTNISYWGDMLNAVNAWVTATYTIGNPYKGPNNDGTLDGRIIRDGTGAGGSVIPLTILHHNDSHGNLVSGAYVGYPKLATLIGQERAHNPNRTILLNGGDQIQGDAMMAYYKTAFTGIAGDGVTTLPITLTENPMMAVMNAMTYTAMTLGNHEFNYGNAVFTNTLKQATFPILQANLYDDGRYGISQVPVKPFITTTLGSENIKVAVLGIGNHRVPQYELPSNIPGLTFTNPITEAQSRAPALKASNDVMIALTHIGFTTNPSSVEVDANVDTNLAAQTTGIDAIIGSHSHTNPASPEAPYKYLPAFVGSADGTPVIINQAYRYNNTLGEVVLGLLPKAGGGYRVVSRAGRYLSVTSGITDDPRIKAIVDPYNNFLAAYNTTVLGRTSVPIDTRLAFTQETNGANLQADASVAELARHGINVDFHLSGAMTNQKVASTATMTNPYTLRISDMFNLMPYENSLVVMRMNGPQLKTVLERAYRNYYYYKYVSGYGGYSYYTTCMLDINAGNKIVYKDTPDVYTSTVDHVQGLIVNGQQVDLSDTNKVYTVSTVNYLAAGSCNNNDGGVTIWPLDQIVADTQYYVRDAVVNYLKTLTGTIAPAIEGRVLFPKFATVDPAAASNLTLPNMTFAIPAGAVSTPISLTYTSIAGANTPSGWQFAGRAFDLEAYVGGVFQPGFTFLKPVRVTLTYSNADVAGIDENALALKYWNGSAWVEGGCSTYERHPDQNWLVVDICHLSQYALFGQGPDLSTSRKTVVDANGNGVAEAGEVLTYTITITNNGSYGAGVVLVDALPTGLTYVPGSLSVSYPSGSALLPNFVAQFYGNTLLGHTNGFLNPPSGGSLYLPTNVIAITFRAQVSNPAPAGTSLSNSIDLQDQIMSYTIPPAVIRLPYRLFLPIIMKQG